MTWARSLKNAATSSIGFNYKPMSEMLRPDFVHDHGADPLEHFARRRRRQQDEERFRRGDKNVRPVSRHVLPLPLGRISGA